jgi:hypothetical protein
MAYIDKIKLEVVNINDGCLMKPDAILSNGQSPPVCSPRAHCHVPDDKFDYSARNRLIVVLILCIVFMIVEIIGMCFV